MEWVFHLFKKIFVKLNCKINDFYAKIEERKNAIFLNVFLFGFSVFFSFSSFLSFRFPPTMPLCSTHTFSLCTVSVLQQLNIRMANFGKAFSWITRTILGTESSANLDCHGHSSNSLASKTDDNLGLFISILILSRCPNTLKTCFFLGFSFFSFGF